MVNVFCRSAEIREALRSGRGAEGLIRRMAAAALGCAVLYGAVLGAQVGGWHRLAGPVKLPLILLGTCAICLPALYVLLALAGARLDWRQAALLGLCSVTASSLGMAALLPPAAFWGYALGGGRSTLTLVHSAAFVLAGTVGARFGRETARDLFDSGRPRLAMAAWGVLYGLVAQQMAWLFRPHFHATEVFMRPWTSGGSALEALFRLLLEIAR